ncbi:MAG: DUF2812 domain-containing protein [Acidobacteriota bacterium]
MSGEKTTRRVFRIFMAWNDEKEGRWLAQQERDGWRLSGVGCFAYRFERAAPADVAYRLDYGPPKFQDKSEYFGIFQDAGWEHVGSRKQWQVFRKPIVDGRVPEIYTDPRSRIAMYRRLLGLMLAMLAMLGIITAVNLDMKNSIFERVPFTFGLYIGMMTVFAYGAVRILLIISRLRRNAPRPF